MDRITRLTEYTAEANEIKEKIKQVAKEKGVTIENNIDTPLTVLDKISTQPTGEYNIETMLNEDGTQILNITHKDYKPYETTFSANTPSQISKVSALISENNMNSQQVYETYGWSIGDSISIPLTNGEEIEMQIIGINHDDKSDGTGKAGLTLQMVNCLATLYPMNSTSTNAGGYPASPMKTTTLPTIKLLLPQEWQDVIKLVDKKSANGGSSNFSQVVTLSEDIFLLSQYEVWASAGYAQSAALEGSQYEFWQMNTGSTPKIKQYDKNGDGVVDTKVSWWFRSCVSTMTNSYIFTNTSGSSSRGASSNSNGISFAFCV